MYHYTFNTSTPGVSSVVHLVYSEILEQTVKLSLFKKYSSHMKYKINWPYS